jgi:hypothetical protein
MQDALHHIGVCRRDRAEHVPGHVGAPLSHAPLVGPQQLFLGDNTRQIEDRPLQVGVCDEKGAEGRAVAAAHVTEMGEPREVIRVQGSQH